MFVLIFLALCFSSIALGTLWTPVDIPMRDGKTLAEGEARHCDADDQRLIVTTPVYDKGEYRIALTER